jgi:hypothetical protein
LKRGYRMMVGREKSVIQQLVPVFASHLPGSGDIPRTPGREKLNGTSEGYLHCGSNGAGHASRSARARANFEMHSDFDDAVFAKLQEWLRYISGDCGAPATHAALREELVHETLINPSNDRPRTSP